MEKQEVQKVLAGFGNELKDIVATAGKDAVAQTLEEFKGNAIEVLKNEFINQLQSTKEDLVAAAFPAQARYRHGVPELCAVPPPHGG